jgi:hypothetical protein
MSRRLALASLMAAAMLNAPLTALAADEPTARLRAFLGDREIATSEAGRHHCHDLDHPVVRCYRSAAEAERAVAERLQQEASLLATNFVRVFEHASYNGASAYLSQNYSDLGSIGWNDRISSYRVLNGGSGTFHQPVSYSGIQLGFCCNDNVSSLSATYNDQFSSVQGSA